MKQIKITAMTVYITDIPVRLMRRHGSGDVAGSVKNAILKLETDAGITGWGDAAPWAVFTGTIEANAAALHVYLRPVLIGADPFRIAQLMYDADHAVVEVAAFAWGERHDGALAVTSLSSVAREHPDSLCREAAVAAIGAIGAPAGLPAVLAGCDDRATVRRRAVAALAAFDGP